jgi:hypothetical protein
MFKYVNAGSSQSLKLDGLVVSDSNSIPFVRIKKKSIPFVKNPDIVHQRNLVEVSLYRLCDFTMPGSDLVQQRLLLIFMEISSSSHWESQPCCINLLHAGVDAVFVVHPKDSPLGTRPDQVKSVNNSNNRILTIAGDLSMVVPMGIHWSSQVNDAS